MNRHEGTARGVALLELGRPVDAEMAFRQSLAANPHQAEVLVLLARALLQQGRAEEARGAAQAALASEPENPDGLLTLSVALATLADFDGALEVVRRGLWLAPSIAAMHRQEAHILLAKKQPNYAIEPLQRARALQPHDSTTFTLLALAYFDLGRFPEAEQAVGEALRLDPESPTAHRIRGLLELRKGGGRAAVDSHRSAVRLDPFEESYREGLATALKSRNPLYGMLLRLSDWYGGLPGIARLLFLLGPFIATRVLRPVQDELWAQLILVAVVSSVVLMWTLEPLMNTVLLCGRRSRHLVSQDARRATSVFLAYLAAAIAAVVLGLATSRTVALTLAVGLALWSVAAGHMHMVAESRARLTRNIHAAGGVLAIAAVVMAAVNAPAAAPLVVAVMISGIAMAWYTVFA